VATKIQAREIMRIAKRLGKKVVRKHATAEYGCARNVLSAEMSRIHGDHILSMAMNWPSCWAFRWSILML
jgi:hypothetical protein